LPKKPTEGDFFPVTVWHTHQQKAQIDLPFNRYYMEETLAPEAERAYRRHSTRKQRDAYITVRVLSGTAVLEELYVADMPIGEFLKPDS